MWLAEIFNFTTKVTIMQSDLDRSANVAKF